MTKEETDLIIAEQNRSKEEILKAVAKVKSDYQLKDMRFAELEKENAELKEEIKKWQGKYTYKCRIENYLETQLTKAKEIIKSLLPMASNFVFGTLPKLDEEVQLYRQAEQFLNGENTILEDAQAGNSPFDADEVFNKEIKAYPEEEIKEETEK